MSEYFEGGKERYERTGKNDRKAMDTGDWREIRKILE
jgi:hypothetical protein